MRYKILMTALLIVLFTTSLILVSSEAATLYITISSIDPPTGPVGTIFNFRIDYGISGTNGEGHWQVTYVIYNPGGDVVKTWQTPLQYGDDSGTLWTSITADSAGTWKICADIDYVPYLGAEHQYDEDCKTWIVTAEGGGGGDSKKPTKLTIAVNPDTVEPGKTFSVGGGLFDASQSDWWNYPIAGATITVTFNGQTKTATTRSDGGWSVVFTAPSQEGRYAVRASFAGNSQYDGTSASTTVKVQRPSKKNCIIELIYPEKVHVGDVVNITVVLRDAETHQEIKGKVVTLYIEADSHQIESGSSFTIQAKYPGTIDVGARFEGDSEYNGAYDPGGLIEVWTRPRITITYVGCGEG